jgi:hypothetical protein
MAGYSKRGWPRLLGICRSESWGRVEPKEVEHYFRYRRARAKRCERKGACKVDGTYAV